MATWLNVKDFGAIGDDIADDYNAIQTAINSLINNNNALNGGIVYFPAGKYRITQPLLTSNFVTLQGDGANLLEGNRGGSRIEAHYSYTAVNLECTLSSGSGNITTNDPANGLAVGMSVAGKGIDDDTIIVGLGPPDETPRIVSLNRPTSASGLFSLTFGSVYQDNCSLNANTTEIKPSSLVNLVAGMKVTGVGIPANTFISSVGTESVTLTNKPVITTNSAKLAFGLQKPAVIVHADFTAGKFAEGVKLADITIHDVNGNGSYGLFLSSFRHNCIIKNVAVIGFDISIYANKSWSSRLEQVSATSFRTTGFKITDNVNNVVFEQCHVLNGSSTMADRANQTGFYLNKSANLILSNLHVETNVLGNGLWIDSCSSVNIDGLYFENSPAEDRENGISAIINNAVYISSSKGISLNTPWINGNGFTNYGVSISDSPKVVILGGSIVGCGLQDIIETNSTAVRNEAVAINTFMQNPGTSTQQANGRNLIIGSKLICHGSYSSVPASFSGLTYNKGDIYYPYNPDIGKACELICTQSGTYGTLNSVTGTIAAGDNILYTNDLGSMQSGKYINILGVTDPKRIQTVYNNTISLQGSIFAGTNNLAVQAIGNITPGTLITVAGLSGYRKVSAVIKRLAAGIQATGTIGNATITLSSAGPLTLNSYISISGINDPRRVTAINGTTATLDYPIDATIANAPVYFAKSFTLSSPSEKTVTNAAITYAKRVVLDSTVSNGVFNAATSYSPPVWQVNSQVGNIQNIVLTLNLLSGVKSNSVIVPAEKKALKIIAYSSIKPPSPIKCSVYKKAYPYTGTEILIGSVTLKEIAASTTELNTELIAADDVIYATSNSGIRLTDLSINLTVVDR